MFWGDQGKTCEEIAKFSAKDATAYPDYEALLARLAAFVEPLLLTAPPDPLSRRPGDIYESLRLGWKARGLGEDVYEKVRILSQSAADFLERWFESEPLKATLATDGVIGAFAGPRTPGTAYVLLHHVMGESFGKKGVWAYVRGGMGGIARALEQSLSGCGGEVRTDAHVESIIVENGRAAGVALRDGSEIRARCILSNADPKRTFLGMLDSEHLEGRFLDQVKKIRYRSASFKMSLALGGVPNWQAYPGDSAPGPQHHGTVHISPTIEYIEKAFDDARDGRCSEKPVLECTMPSALDDSLAPPGKHLMSVFVQYAPYDLDGDWEGERGRFADRCIDLIDEYAPGFKSLIEDRHLLSPRDMEQEYQLTGGNIFQGEMTLDQLFFMRPLPDCSRYQTPIENLYLCGAGTHPGGGVMGACGHNAAQAVLSIWKRRKD
jgi:phytoene dehydrogenase-like protein